MNDKLTFPSFVKFYLLYMACKKGDCKKVFPSFAMSLSLFKTSLKFMGIKERLFDR